MAHPDQLQQINQIAEALNSCERRTVYFLCESSDTDNQSVGHMKEMLKSKVLCHQNAHLFLPELMLRLGRFDILAKVYKVSRDDVERTLGYTQVLSTFSQELCSDDMDSLAFLLRGTLPWERMENAKDFLDLIIELEKFDLVSPTKVDLLEQCLLDIGRVDQAKKVTSYKLSASLAQTSELHLSQEESHSVSTTRKENSLHAATANMALPVREQSTENAHDCYKFNSNPRGVCVIIDCVGNDGEMLEETFKALNFNTVLYKWMSAGDIHSALTGILRKAGDHGGDAFVCCIISRGTGTHLMGTDLYGTDLPMDTIRALVTAHACPKLADKPKLFFIQRYSVPELPQQNEDLGAWSCDGMSSKHYVLEDSNLFWSHCWTDECHLEQEHHSIYLKVLTEALRNSHERKTNLVDVHAEVNEAIFEHNKRNPDEKYQIDAKHTLLKHLYLE